MSETSRYPRQLADLLERMPLAPLGPGKPVTAMRQQLASLNEAVFGEQIRDRRMIEACRAGLWLAFDFLDESHAISQSLEPTEGSFWHAIMHRREPDAWNSKYWWRRVGAHPVLDALKERAASLGYDFIDSFAFVDFVERVRDTGTPEEATAQKVQALEWQLLFEHCYYRAVSA